MVSFFNLKWLKGPLRWFHKDEKAKEKEMKVFMDWAARAQEKNVEDIFNLNNLRECIGFSFLGLSMIFVTFILPLFLFKSDHTASPELFYPEVTVFLMLFSFTSVILVLIIKDIKNILLKYSEISLKNVLFNFSPKNKYHPLDENNLNFLLIKIVELQELGIDTSDVFNFYKTNQYFSVGCLNLADNLKKNLNLEKQKTGKKDNYYNLISLSGLEERKEHISIQLLEKNTATVENSTKNQDLLSVKVSTKNTQ